MKTLTLLLFILVTFSLKSQSVYSFYASFEDQTFNATVGKAGLEATHGGQLTIVHNPKKQTPNNSNFCVKAETFPKPTSDYCRAEYKSDAGARFPTMDKRHIYQWHVYFPESYMQGVTSINARDWLSLSQFSTYPCEEISAKYPYFADSICGTGGIFNSLKVNKFNTNSYDFKFRAYPDCSEINYTFPKGKWIKITYEIFYTTKKTGYYRVWVDEKLIGQQYNIRTLMGGFIDPTCRMYWKVGMYTSWQGTGSLYYYFDNLKLYINKRIQDVCVNCKY